MLLRLKLANTDHSVVVVADQVMFWSHEPYKDKQIAFDQRCVYLKNGSEIYVSETVAEIERQYLEAMKSVYEKIAIDGAIHEVLRK